MLLPVLLFLMNDAAPATRVPAPAPTPPKATLSVQFLSPNERREESIEVTLARTDERSGPGKPFETRKLSLPVKPKLLKVLFGKLDAGRYLLSWSGPDVARGEKPVELKAIAPFDAGTITLGPGLSVEGIVRDETGEPVGNIGISFQPDALHDRRRVETDPAGRFAMAGLPAGEKWSWVVLDASRPYFQASGTWAGESWLDVVLQRAPLVKLRVIDERGEPVTRPTVSVVFSERGGHTRRMIPAEAGPDGSLSFAMVRPVKSVVTIAARGFVSATREIGASAEELRRDEIDLGTITLSAGRTLSGFVVDAEAGRPIDGATVSIRPGERIDGALSPFLVVSDASGHYELAGVPEKGSWLVWASKAGFVPQIRSLDEATSGDLSFALGRGGRIEGRLCVPPEEQSTAIVSASPPRPLLEGKISPLDFSGRFVIEGLAPGTWTLTPGTRLVSADGRSEKLRVGGGESVSVLVEEGRTSTVSIGCGTTGRSGS
jgi:hypothetical protein